MMCQNETYNNKCRTIDEINSYFETSSLSLVYATNFFQTSNYSTPTAERLMKNLYKLEARFNRLVTISLQKATLITEEMILLSNGQNRETYVYETENTELGVTNSVASPIASFLFISSNNHLTVRRVYQSLTEVAAVVGGLFSFLVMLGKVLSEVDKSIFITTELINFLYSFPEQKPFFMKQNAFKTTTTATAEIQLIDGKGEEDFRSESPKGVNNVLSIRSNKQIEADHLMLRMCGESPKSVKSVKKQRTKSSGHVEAPHIERLIGDLPEVWEHYSRSDEKFEEKSSHLQIPANYKAKVPNLTQIPINKGYLPIDHKKASKMKQYQLTLPEFMTFRQEQDLLAFNIFDYLRLLFKKLLGLGKSFRVKLFEKAQEKFEGEIDLVNVLQRLQDIEQLKEILLTKEQSALISLLEKPMILGEDFQKKLKEKEKKKKKSNATFEPLKRSVLEKNTIEIGFNYYLDLAKKNRLDPFEERLFEMMDKKFQTFRILLKDYKGELGKKEDQVDQNSNP